MGWGMLGLVQPEAQPMKGLLGWRLEQQHLPRVYVGESRATITNPQLPLLGSADSLYPEHHSHTEN